MCSNIKGKESNEADATEGQEFVLGDKVLMSQTYCTFTTKKISEREANPIEY